MTWVGSLGYAFGHCDLWWATVTMRRLNLTSFVIVVSSSVCKNADGRATCCQMLHPSRLNI